MRFEPMPLLPAPMRWPLPRTVAHPVSISLVADVTVSGNYLDNLPDDLVEEIWSIVVNDTREDTMQELLLHTPVVAPVRIKACSWCGISRECRYCEGCLSGVRARYCSKSEATLAATPACVLRVLVWGDDK